MKNNYEKQIISVFFILFSISIIVFAVISFVNWSSLTGFLVGTIVSMLLWLINKYYVSKLLSKRRSFKLGFFASFLKSIIWLIIITGTLIGILFANNLLTNSSWIDGVFNVFAFVYGVLLMPVAIISWNIADRVSKNKINKEK